MYYYITYITLAINLCIFILLLIFHCFLINHIINSFVLSYLLLNYFCIIFFVFLNDEISRTEVRDFKQRDGGGATMPTR